MNIKTFWMLIIMFIVGSFFHFNVKKIEKKYKINNPSLEVPVEKKPFFSFFKKKENEEEEDEEETNEDI